MWYYWLPWNEPFRAKNLFERENRLRVRQCYIQILFNREEGAKGVSRIMNDKLMDNGTYCDRNKLYY